MIVKENAYNVRGCGHFQDPMLSHCEGCILFLIEDWKEEWRKQYGAYSLCEQMIKDIEIIAKGCVDRYIETAPNDHGFLL